MRVWVDQLFRWLNSLVAELCALLSHGQRDSSPVQNSSFGLLTFVMLALLLEIVMVFLTSNHNIHTCNILYIFYRKFFLMTTAEQHKKLFSSLKAILVLIACGSSIFC